MTKEGKIKQKFPKPKSPNWTPPNLNSHWVDSVVAIFFDFHVHSFIKHMHCLHFRTVSISIDQITERNMWLFENYVIYAAYAIENTQINQVKCWNSAICNVNCLLIWNFQWIDFKRMNEKKNTSNAIIYFHSTFSAFWTIS